MIDLYLLNEQIKNLRDDTSGNIIWFNVSPKHLAESLESFPGWFDDNGQAAVCQIGKLRIFQYGAAK